MSYSEVLDYLNVIKQRSRGIIFVFVIFYTSFTGFFIFGPVFLSVFVFKFDAARWIIDSIMSTWFLLASAMYELVFGVKIVVKGDVSKIDKAGSSLIIMNHRTRLDWLFFFSVQARYGSLRRFKISLKDELKHIPGSGWAMQAANFLFLKRKWEQDQVRLAQGLNHCATYHCNPQLLLFPEGTDFQTESREKSRAYAKKNDLPDFDYVLQPRTTGFTYVLEHMQKHNNLSQVVDVTISYPQNIMQNESDLINGDIPREIVFTINCFDMKDLPLDVDPCLEKWLGIRWQKKEQYLKTFYETGTYADDTGNGLSFAQNLENQRDLTMCYISSMVMWVIVSAITFYMLVFSHYGFLFCAISFIFYICIDVGYGFDKLFLQLSSR